MKMLALILLICLSTTFDAHVQAAGGQQRICQNLFPCIPYLMTVKFNDIVNITSFYTGGSLLKLSEISDREWNNQMNMLTSMCGAWLNFDACMDQDWFDCIDWNQMTSLIQMVGNTGNTANTPQRGSQQRLNEMGWTVNDTKTMMVISSQVCRNVETVVPSLSCMRDLLLSNETIINITLWYRALSNQPECMKDSGDCDKVEKVCKMYGNWLYHGCSEGRDGLIPVVKAVFAGMQLNDGHDCQNIFQGKTAKDVFEPPYDKQIEYNFGNNFTARCDLNKAKRDMDFDYFRSVATYFARLNVSREEFYHQMACKQRKLSLAQCDIWPIPTAKAPPTTTSKTNLAPVIIQTQPLPVSRGLPTIPNGSPPRRQTTTASGDYYEDYYEDETTTTTKRNRGTTTAKLQKIKDEKQKNNAVVINFDRRSLAIFVFLTSAFVKFS